MLGTGEGAELRRPLGIAIVGGLVVIQVLTLYTTPVAYLCLAKIRVSVNRRRGHAVADEVVPDGSLTDARLRGPPRLMERVRAAKSVADHFRVRRSTITFAGATSAFTATLSPLRLTITGRELMMSSAD